MPDWQGLEVFVVAARLENFSAAAQELHLSQPAVTQRIQALEREFGVKLFEREGRRVRLSEAGDYLLPLADDLLRRARRVEEMMRSLSGKVVGHLVLGCSTTSGKYVLPGILARFCERYPGVRATVRMASRACVLEMLRSREAQIVFTSVPVDQNELIYRKFFEDDIILVAPEDHPWSRRDVIAPHELLGERFILREPTSGTYLAMERALTACDIQPSELNTVMTLGNSEAIIMAVEEGIGVGFVPRLAAERSLMLGQVREIRVQGVSMMHTIWMVESTLYPATAAQLRFLEMLRTEGIIPAGAEAEVPYAVLPEGERCTVVGGEKVMEPG
ncbi:MAG: LysR family transcriptional regulator [Caldilineae bacterium]|nr:MAG: LysR family transcriptional regulator [Caldilineae bacterium]